MDVRACKSCRRLFSYVCGPEICPECIKSAPENMEEEKNNVSSATLITMSGVDQEKYEQVKEYILTNPKSTVAQIAEVNDITPSKLFEWIKADRLEFSDGSEYAWFQCEKCGTKIRSGRFCNRCR